VAFTVDKLDKGTWLSNGLGRDVDVRSPSGTQVWNGFANAVEVSEGDRKTIVGPITDVANSIAMAYAVIIEDADEPVIGEQTTTEYANDTDSQDLYGTWRKIVSGGTRTTTGAEQARDVLLAKYAQPPTSYDIAMMGDQVLVTLRCLGYWKWLDALVYSNSDNDEIQTNEKVELILTAATALNDVISSDYSRIETSSATIGTFEDRNRTGTTIIKECASYGDLNDDYWTFGIYEDRQAVFDVVPNSIAYAHRSGLGPVVERLGGGVIDPWDVRAAQWVFMPDAMPGGGELPIPNTRSRFYADNRVGFIERVIFTAPYGFQVQGTRLRKGTQQLARWGLGSL